VEARRVKNELDFINIGEERRKIRVPDAPFKTTWPSLVMKRMIRYAAENGFDKITWTTGEQQADRYDLSQQVDKVVIGRPPIGSGQVDKLNLYVYKDGNTVLEKDLITPQELADTVGKDLADKAQDLSPGQTKDYTGVDLKVGGEGMKGFYDKMLPSEVNKIVKKWGGKVGDSQLSTGEQVHSLELTPAIESAAMEGMPMFAVKRAQVAGVPEIGEERESENIEGVRQKVRERVFNSNAPVTPENTENAWHWFGRLAYGDERSRFDTASEIKDTLDGSRIGGALHAIELMRYALKMAASGDSSLFRQILNHTEDLATNPGMGFSSSGSNLRGALELMDEPVIKFMRKLFDENLEKTAEKNSGLNHEIFMKIVDGLKDLGLKPEDVESAINKGSLPDGTKLEDMLSKRAKEPVDEKKVEKSAAQAFAEAKLKQLEMKQQGAEWLKPETSRKKVRDVIADWMSPDNPHPVDASHAANVEELTQKLIAAGVDEGTARPLANALEAERQTTWANERVKAMERASNSKSLRSLIESILADPLRAQSDPNWVHNMAVRWFESSGLSRDQAEAATRLFDAQFQKALGDARARIVEGVLNKNGVIGHEDLIKLMKTGAMDPNSPWIDQIAAKTGWRKPTAEEYRKLIELQQKWEGSGLPEDRDRLSLPEKNAVMEQINSILRNMGSHDNAWINALAESMAASLLSGPRTMTLHIFQPAFSMIFKDFPTIIASHPQDLPTMAKMFLTAAKSYLPEFKYAWQHDAFGFSETRMGGYYSELKRQCEIGEQEIKSGNYLGALRFAYGWGQYVFRFLQTANQAGMVMKREFAMSLYGSRIMREAGFNTKQIAELTTFVPAIKEGAYMDGIMRLGLDENTARVRADYVAADQLNAFFANKLNSDTKAKEIYVAALNEAYSTTGFRRPEIKDLGVGKGIKEEDEGFLRNMLGVTKLMRLMQSMRQEGGVQSMVGIAGFGFVNVPLRMALFNANFFGYGVLRWGIHHYRTNGVSIGGRRYGGGMDTPWKQTYANDAMAKQRLTEALVGTAIGFGFMGWAYNNSTADDQSKKAFFINATGNGPKNKTLRDAWLKAGYKPYSLIIGLNGKVAANLPITRVGGVLAWPLGLSAAMDDVAWASKSGEASGRQPNRTPQAELAQMAGTYYEVVGAQGIFQGISHMNQVSEGGGGMAKVLASSISGTAAAILIPGKQLLSGVSQMIWGNPDRSSIEAAIAANFPIIGMPWKHPQVNSLGDPLGDNTWYGKMSMLGLPVAFKVEDNQQNRALYQMMLDKGVAPPDLKRTILEDKYGPLTDDQYEQFAMQRGAAIKAQLLNEVSTLNSSPAPDVKRSVGALASKADAETAMSLGLLPVAKPGRTARQTSPTTTARPRAQQAAPATIPHRRVSTPRLHKQGATRRLQHVRTLSSLRPSHRRSSFS
jgi:hypothetical protein